MTFWKRQNYGDVKRLVAKVRKEGGMNRAQIFRPVKTILYGTIMVDT